MNNQCSTPATTLYREALRRGLVLGNHASDLDLDNRGGAATALLRDYGLAGASVQGFIDETTGHPAVRVFAAYDPFWERRS